MSNYELSNYALTSTHNTSYIFFLKSPQLISNSNIYFDQTNPYIHIDDKPTLRPMTYYHLKYSITDKKKCKIKILQAIPLSLIGEEWKSDLFMKHLQNYQGALKQPDPNYHLMKEEMENGELRVNDEGWIYVKSTQSGFRKKLKMVNSSYAIPLLKGCKVDFFLRKYAENEGPKVKISKLHFRSVTLSGILKMINGRIFFEPRHTDYERMIPLTVPQTLMAIIYDCLPNFRGSLPYNIFKRYQGDHEKLNKSLSQFVLQGRFLDWPLRFSHPIIIIESLKPMTCINLKQATLYELGIPILDYDQEENRLSNEIIKNFQPESYAGRWQVAEKCYTFDCEGGSCFDDAFSVKKLQKSFLVSIHISDVPALVGSKPYLLQRARARDQTIYIKNYYKSMFPQQLRNIMSLVEDNLRLTFSLTFEISFEGKINYESIELRESIIKVVQNITHGDVVQDIEDRQMFIDLLMVLKKCKEVQKIMIFEEIQTAVLTSQLLYLSAYLPIVAFTNNINKLPQLIKRTVQFCQQATQKAAKLLAQFQAQKLQPIFVKQSQIQTDSPENIQLGNTQQSNELLMLSQNVEQLEQMSKSNVNLQINSSSSSSSSEIQENQVQPELEAEKKSQIIVRSVRVHKNEFFRKVSSKEGSAAQCFRFLDKLFKAAELVVDYSRPKNIQAAFKECEKKYNDKIAELYFRTKLIMSKQHFEAIAKLTKEGKLKQFTMTSSAVKYPPSLEKQKEIKENGSEKKQIVRQDQNKKQEEEKKQNDGDSKVVQTLSEDGKQNVSPQEGANSQPEKKVEEAKKQQKQENQLSLLISILAFISQSHLELNCSLSKEQVISDLNLLRSLAKEKKAEVMERSQSEIGECFNRQILKTLAYNDFAIGLEDAKPMKWNTPIRSGASLHALTLLKNFSWIFQGSLLPSVAIKHQKDILVVEEHIRQILKERSLHESLQLNGRMKEACRELEKIDFLFILRQQPQKVWDFLTITSPSQRVQFVYHESIEEVEVDNPQKKISYYSRVRGRFKGTFDFPIKLKVILDGE